jgi:hypothetical protein
MDGGPYQRRSDTGFGHGFVAFNAPRRIGRGADLPVWGRTRLLYVEHCIQ